MNAYMFRWTHRHRAVTYIGAVLIALLAQPATAQRVSLERTRTSVYRALAQLTVQSFQKNDMDTAATLGRILERVWDQNEETGEKGLNKTNPKLFEDIDEAMGRLHKAGDSLRSKAS